MKIPLLLLALPTISTLAGGVLTLKAERWRPWLEAVGAGLLLGAAVEDLLPEALSAGRAVAISPAMIAGLVLVLLLVFRGVEVGLRRAGGGRHSRTAGLTGGGLLIFHSLRDGMAIGAAFSVSVSAGYAVALGIIAHDFADGMNTVLLTTGGKRATPTDYVFLTADALAPFVGGLLTAWWALSGQATVVLLVLAAAFFLEMALADLWAMVRAGKGRRGLSFASVGGGVVVIGLANWLLRLR